MKKYLAYRSEDGSQYLLPVVKNAERMVVEETLDHGYLSPYGVDDFSKLATTLLLGNIEKQWKEGTVRNNLFTFNYNTYTRYTYNQCINNYLITEHKYTYYLLYETNTTDFYFSILFILYDV